MKPRLPLCKAAPLKPNRTSPALPEGKQTFLETAFWSVFSGLSVVIMTQAKYLAIKGLTWQAPVFICREKSRPQMVRPDFPLRYAFARMRSEPIKAARPLMQSGVPFPKASRPVFACERGKALSRAAFGPLGRAPWLFFLPPPGSFLLFFSRGLLFSVA